MHFLVRNTVAFGSGVRIQQCELMKMDSFLRGLIEMLK